MSIIHISGKTRKGKTSMVVAMNIPLLNGTDDERYIESTNYIKVLQKQGEKVTLPPQNHVVSANIDIKDDYPNCKAYKVSGFNLALPAEDENGKELIPTERLIPYGVYILDECAKYYKYAKLPPSVLRMFELHGHYFLQFYLISHRYIGVNKDLRALVDKFWYVIGCEHKYIINGKTVWRAKYIKNCEIIETRWTYIEFEDEGDLDLYLKSTSTDKKHLGKKCTYTFKGDIRTHYDAYNYKEYFEKHPRNFTYSTDNNLDKIGEPKSWAISEGEDEPRQRRNSNH